MDKRCHRFVKELLGQGKRDGEGGQGYNQQIA
jgi:hypothetical protein